MFVGMEQYKQPKLSSSVHPMEGVIKAYAWGATKEMYVHSFAKADPTDTIAEVWYGCHSSGETTVRGKRLSRVCPAFIKSDSPFLLKVLGIGKALSIQCHPNDAQAKILFETDPEHYPDDIGKPEMALAVGNGLHLVCGFRPVEEMLLIAETEHISFMEEIIFRIQDKYSHKGDRFMIKEILREVFYVEQNKPSLLEKAVSRLSKAEGSFMGELYAQHGIDIGVFIAGIMMERHFIPPGEAIYIGAGVLHAYTSGECVEIMRLSDNVVRCGLTPKHIDIQTLFEIGQFKKCPKYASIDVQNVPKSGFRGRKMSQKLSLGASKRGIDGGLGKTDIKTRANSSNKYRLDSDSDSDSDIDVDDIDDISEDVGEDDMDVETLGALGAHGRGSLSNNKKTSQSARKAALESRACNPLIPKTMVLSSTSLKLTLYVPPVPDFALMRLTVRDETNTAVDPDLFNVLNWSTERMMILGIKGVVEIIVNEEKHTVIKGDAFALSLGSHISVISGRGEVVVACANNWQHADLDAIALNHFFAMQADAQEDDGENKNDTSRPSILKLNR